VPFHVIIGDRQVDDAAVLSDHPAAVEEESFRFDEGVPLASWFPKEAVYPMDREFPDLRVLHDLQVNTLGLLVASKAFRAVLEAGAHGNLEFLPITIRDHRRKIASKDHFIVNVLHPVDCVDRKRSTLVMSAIDPTQAISIENPVLREDQIPADVDLFRLAVRTSVFVVRDELKARIESAGLRGMELIPIAEYDSAIHE